VAIIEGAERMNEDAQSALLKTLEEPPAGVVLVLCADQETRLLPTVRSRCARIRLGLVGSRDIEAIVADHDLAGPPMAARLGRLAAGDRAWRTRTARPRRLSVRAGAQPRAARPGRRGVRPRGWRPSGRDPARHRPGGGAVRSERPAGARTTRRRAASPRPAQTRRGAGSAVPAGPAETDDASTDDRADTPGRAVPASERRRAAEILIGLWTDVARDLALAGAGGARSVRDPVMLEELAATSATLEPAAISRFLERSARGRSSSPQRQPGTAARLACPGLAPATGRGLMESAKSDRRAAARLDARITGRVHGVGFRYFVFRERGARPRWLGGQ
jgi:hypothetical protein